MDSQNLTNVSGIIRQTVDLAFGLVHGEEDREAITEKWNKKCIRAKLKLFTESFSIVHIDIYEVDPAETHSIICVGCSHICVPTSWRNPQISIKVKTGKNDLRVGYILTDSSAKVKIICEKIVLKE